MFSGRMEVLTDADGWILIGKLLTPKDQSRYSARPEWETLWSHLELPEGWHHSSARDKEGADGTAGRGQVLLCGRAGAGHRAEPGKIRSGRVGCGTDLQGPIDHQPEGGTGLDHSQQYEACCEVAHQ